MNPDDPYLHRYFSRYCVSHSGARDGRSIVFLVGSTGISGGTYVILQYAEHLLDLGWRVTLAAMNVDHHLDPWHPALERLEICSIEEASSSEYDLAVATWWPTVFELPRIRARHDVYLVQSIEARFYGGSVDDRWAQPLAELTYTFGIPIITIASWMQIYLALRHKAPSFLVRNGVRKDVYTPFGPAIADRRPGHLRVLVEGPLSIPMKNVDAAVRLARAGGADEVWLMTGSSAEPGVAVDRVFERVGMELTPLVYRSCDVLLKLSQVEGMYGPPLEMFHCGGTVVTYDVTGHEEYVVDRANGLVVQMGDEASVIEAIRELKRDSLLLSELQRAALITAAGWPSWDAAAAEFAKFAEGIAKQPDSDRLQRMLAITGAQRDFP
jgi:glycosyltransferase involved in cell wall biosynthesis